MTPLAGVRMLSMRPYGRGTSYDAVAINVCAECLYSQISDYKPEVGKI